MLLALDQVACMRAVVGEETGPRGDRRPARRRAPTPGGAGEWLRRRANCLYNPNGTPTALLQTFAAAEVGDAGERALHQATFGSRRCVINWTTSERADAPSPEARSTRRASPQMSRVMLNAAAWPLRNARITSNPLIVA